MSSNQYGLMYYLADHRIVSPQLGRYNQGTVISLLKREWIARDSKNQIWLTEEGMQELDAYRKHRPPLRKNPGSNTETVENLLKLARLKIAKAVA